MKIINRYISREIALTWMAVTTVLMLILVSRTFVRLLGKVSQGVFPVDAILPLFLFSSLQFLVLLIPIGLGLGVMLAFGRLYRDSEMDALAACGVGIVSLYRPLLTIVVPVTLLTLVLTLLVKPWAATEVENLKAEIRSRSDTTGLIAGRFNETQNGEAVFFMEKQSSDGKYMEGVFSRQQTTHGISIELADKASKEFDNNGRPYLVFSNGARIEGAPGEGGYRVIKFENYGVYVSAGDAVREGPDHEAVSTRDLIRSDKPEYRAELHWRIAMPIAALLLSLLSLPLSYTTPREGRYARLAVAIVLYLLYYNLLGVGQTWIEQQKGPMWLGLWWVHGLLLILTLVMVLKRSAWSIWPARGVAKQ